MLIAFGTDWETYRAESREQVNQGVAWIKDMVKGAGLATQTEGIAIDYFGVHDLLQNTPFAERMQKHYAATTPLVRMHMTINRSVTPQRRGSARSPSTSTFP